jgi:hypothetical protein
MIEHSRGIAVVAVLVTGALSGYAGPVGAVGSGTFTKIDTPSKTITFHYDSSQPSGHHLFVAGSTSADVTTVDIVCMSNSPTGPTSQTLAPAVPVTGGTFSANVDLSIQAQCRLRAVPQGVDELTAYVGSFSGPILYLTGVQYSTVGSTRVGYVAVDEQGNGLAAIEDAGQCGPATTITIEPPGMDIRGSAGQSCAFALPSANITPSGIATASSIKVDGHNAYLPFHVQSFLNQSPQSLGLTQPPLTISFARLANGDATLTETAKLWRCSVGDTYPPTSVSCPSLVDTGVTFRRVSNLIRGAHQVRIRDTFTGTDAQAHKVNLLYEGTTAEPDTGRVGYTFPGGSNVFSPAALDMVVQGLGTKAGTMYSRSDLFAAPDEPSASTLGRTWSRAPLKVQFAHDQPDLFGLPYTLHVPTHGRADLGFGYSGAPTTAGARQLATIVELEMINPPTISSPANHATIHGKSTTVKGSVTLGANGLPTSVVVNGDAAHLTLVSATKATYSVTFSESLGTHTIKVVAKDAAGNTASRSISVKNV